MQLQASHLYISDTPLPSLPTAPPSSLQPLHRLDLLQLQTPMLYIVFTYQTSKQYTNQNIQIQTQVSIKGQKLSTKHHTYNTHNNQYTIVKNLEIDSCQCYEQVITVNVIVKYREHEQTKCIESVEQLAEELSKRTYTLYSDKNIVVYKRDVIIKEPLATTYRYSATGQQGYLWMKCHNLRVEYLKVKAIILQNWLINGDNQELRVFRSQSSLKGTVVLRKGESIGVILTLPNNLGKEQIPYAVEFQIGDKEQIFKMIKYVYID